ncbi:MAG: hypothetical protein M5R37_07895 [Melioribacteraceae bacterium]|jgi:hypothetical protein|nr:hypothetical protein [Melioribacteraceae bacterium]
MKKDKTFCDLSKDYIAKHLDEIIPLINNPKFICKKCARAANDETHLCKPVKIKNHSQ